MAELAIWSSCGLPICMMMNALAMVQVLMEARFHNDI
jgi:hypothetical protein